MSGLDLVILCACGSSDHQVGLLLCESDLGRAKHIYNGLATGKRMLVSASLLNDHVPLLPSHVKLQGPSIQHLWGSS
jgi:hypothetical protein